MFKKIKIHKVSEEIARQIRELIKQGKLQPGEQLPPERTFAKMLGVSRSSLRQAVSLLQTQGFIESKKRKGLFVRSLSTAIITDPIRQMIEQDKKQLVSLYELRKDIELAAAYSAALHRTEEDLQQMKHCLKRLAESASNDELLLSDDLNLHMAIAKSGKNIFRSHVLKNIFDLSDEHLQYVKEVITGETEYIATLLEQHSKIVEAIENRDPAGARSMMSRHLEWVQEKWKGFIMESETTS